MPQHQWKDWENLFDEVANAAFNEHEYQESMDELLEFVITYGPLYRPSGDDEKLSRCISAIAYNLHQQYPEESIRDMFARFCEALVAYGEMLGQGKRHS